jgi:hypothetical protein
MPDNSKMKQFFKNVREDFGSKPDEDEEEKRRKEEERRRKLEALKKMRASSNPKMEQFFANVKKDFE